MTSLALHDFHAGLNATFGTLAEMELVDHYGDVPAEYAALRQSVGLIDLSFRGRLCLIGADRQQFLNGQVSNNLKMVKPGQGCYATLLTAKGRMVSDLNIHCLEQEILLDFEPGLSTTVSDRLQKFIIADDVQVVDVSNLYGLLSVQGPKAASVVDCLISPLPSAPMSSSKKADADLGEIYIVCHSRAGNQGYDIYAPVAAMQRVAEQLLGKIKENGGTLCGWQALEITRVEAGIPRFGADMDQSNLPHEAGLESQAISYKKGCYVGQEIVARLRVHGRVAKALRGLRLSNGAKGLPCKGDKMFSAGKEVGYVTSATTLPTTDETVALGYVRREVNEPGTILKIQTKHGEIDASVASLPFSQI